MNTFRNVLAEYLIRIDHLQIIGESIRQNIARNTYFQYETIFERMDKFRKGYLIPSDLSQFMFENKIYPTEIEIYMIFKDFDPTRIGTVTLDKFAEQILPQESQKLMKEASSKKYYKSGLRLQIDLEYLMAKYFQHKIRVYNQLEPIRLKIFEIYPAYTEEAFSLIDRQKKMFLSVSDIDVFLRSSGKLLKSEEITRIFKFISQSKVLMGIGDFKLYFQTFVDSIDPLQQGFYIRYASRMVQKRQMQNKHIQKRLVLQDQIMRNSRRQIQAISEIQQLRNSRNNLQDIRLKRQLEHTRSHLFQDQIWRKYQY